MPAVPSLRLYDYAKGSPIYVLQYGRARGDDLMTIGRHGIDMTAEHARLDGSDREG